MLLTVQIENITHEHDRNFFLRAAKAWQNYFETQGLLPGIDLSKEQIAVIQQDEKHMMINGSAGSGKSLTLIYKLLKVITQAHESQRILYLTFNPILIDDARKRLRLSSDYEQHSKKHTIHLYTYHDFAYFILRDLGFHQVRRLSMNIEAIKQHEDLLKGRLIVIRDRITQTPEYRRLHQNEQLFATHNASFLLEEIYWMKANGYINRETYLDIERVGRGHNPRLTKTQRNIIYQIFEEYQRVMKENYHHDMDMEDYALYLLKYHDQIPSDNRYDYIFIDEVQDLQPMQIKSLVNMARKSIVISGDPKQRIYKRTPFSFADLGLQVQGRRSRTLKRNFRSTKQIMALASSLSFEDTDNDREDDQVFVREGPLPEIRYYSKLSYLARYLIREIKSILNTSPTGSVAVIHRYEEELIKNQVPGIKQALQSEFDLITTREYHRRFNYNATRKPIFFTDVFSIKGLEFDYVFILNFDRKHYPLQKRIDELNQRSNQRDQLGDSYSKDYDSILNDEKKLLYVAITRAKQKVVLLFSDNYTVSPFIREFRSKDFLSYGFNKTQFSN